MKEKTGLVREVLSAEIKRAVVLGWTKSRIKNNKNLILIINGETGCLSGDTVLYGQTKTLQELYDEGNINIPTISMNNKLKYYPYPIKSNSEIIYSGLKELFEVELEDGRKVKATLDHTFFVKEKGKMVERKLSEIKVGDSLKLIDEDKQIKSIKSIGVHKTFDLNTPVYHNFILSNGILTHNSGKTYAGLKFAVDCAQVLGTKFSIQNNMDFNFVELLKKMEYIEDNKIPGTVFFFEEVGAVGSGAGSKEWQTNANKFFSSFGQTSRHLRQVFIMTCPSFTNLQKDTRELCHMQWEMMGINTQSKLSFIKPRKIQVNRTSGKMYMKYIRFNYEGEKFTLKRLDMDLPPASIIEEYEKAKNKFTTALNKRIIDSGTEKVADTKPNEKNVALAKKMLANKKVSGFTYQEIADSCGLSHSYVRRLGS